MFQTATLAAKLKIILALLPLLLIGGAYSYQDAENPNTATHTDSYTLDIQQRSDLVFNAVMEANDRKAEYGSIAYKQTCESSLGFIQGEQLDTNTNYNTLDADKKELIDNYKTYLKESANVVSAYRSGETPDLTAMKTAKADLY